MKLIDILNMISKGKLKEGTKIKFGEDVYVYGNQPFPHAFLCEEKGYCLDAVMVLNDECKIIKEAKQ